jgi:regulator of sigma E protease
LASASGAENTFMMDFLHSFFSSVWFGLLLLAFFGVSIFIHELGHFLVARWCGLRVDVFAIGFGPAIWKRRHRGVLYKVGIFPVGGYVALPQLDPTGMSRIQGTDGTDPAAVLSAVAPWRKVLVSVAGAAGNILLAVGLAWVVYLVGIPAGPAERSSVVGYVEPRCASYDAGLRIGDTIRSVNGKAVSTWTEARMEVAFHQAVDLVVADREGATRTIHVPTEGGMLGEQSLKGVDGPSLCMVLRVEPGKSADLAGLRTDDVIVAFAGEEVYSRGHLTQLVHDHADEPTEVVVKRRVGGNEERVTLTVTPRMDPALHRARIGIEFNLAAVELDTVVRPRPMEQLKSHASAIFRFLGALGTPKQARAASKAVGGPVAILVSYWYIVKTSPMLAVWFTGLLNVNLAIINLLPIPVLDGGHITFSLLEAVRRKPLNARLVNALYNVFAILLISLIIVLSVRDVDRFTPVGRLMRGWFDHDAAPAVTNTIATTSDVPATGE